MMSSMYLNWVAIYYLYSTSLASKAMRLGLKMIVFTSLILVNFISLLLSHKTMWGTWMVMQLFHNKLRPLKWLLYTSTCPLDLTLWHRRCSHLNFADLKHMHLHNKVKGMVIKSKTPPDPICDSCIMGKQRRHNIPKTATRRHSTLALIHTDLKGPLPVVSLQGHSYWQALVDDASWFWVVAFLSRKSEALTAFKRYKAHAEKALDKSIMVSRDDKGGEFISKEYFDYTADEGIRRQH